MPPRSRRKLRSWSMPALLAVALTLAVPVAASAYDWRNGDRFVGLSTGQYNGYENGGAPRRPTNQSGTEAGHFAVDCAFDRASVLYTTAFAQNTVVRFL